jgi:transposase
MAFIRGLDRGETFLLPPTVDDFIGRENPARAIDAFVDRLDLRALGFGLRDGHAGGPASYHPAMLLKLHLWGYLRRALEIVGMGALMEALRRMPGGPAPAPV